MSARKVDSLAALIELPYQDALRAFRRAYFEAALHNAGNNRSAAARAAKVNRTWLHRVMQQTGIANDLPARMNRGNAAWRALGDQR